MQLQALAAYIVKALLEVLLKQKCQVLEPDTLYILDFTQNHLSEINFCFLISLK